MKICIYGTQVIPTNPDLDQYGGLELIAGLLAKYLDEVGHEVHLFACEGSYFTKDKNGKKSGSERSHLYVVGKPGTNPIDAWKAYWDDPRTRKILTEADIVCDMSWGFYPYSVYNQLKHICHPHHGPTPGFNTKPPGDKQNFIGISFDHAKQMMKLSPGTTWRTVHNGIPTYKYKFNDKPIKDRERLLWLSRIYFPKGTHRAIDIANRLKMPIDIVGGSFGDVKQYTDQIKKACEESEYAVFHGEVDFAKKLEFYRNAKCVILPIIESGMHTPNGNAWEWHEPFGLVVAEAGSCGTPTIVPNNGGWSESLIHGYNGFFANTDSEFEYYIKQINNIKPENCRKRAEDFDYKVMGANYVKLFEEILETGGW